MADADPRPLRNSNILIQDPTGAGYPTLDELRRSSKGNANTFSADDGQHAHSVRMIQRLHVMQSAVDLTQPMRHMTHECNAAGFGRRARNSGMHCSRSRATHRHHFPMLPFILQMGDGTNKTKTQTKKKKAQILSERKWG